MHAIASALLSQALSSDTMENEDTARTLLAALYQRHPTRVRTAADALSDSAPEQAEFFTALVRALALPLPASTSAGTGAPAVLGSADADAAVRAAAVAELYAALADGDVQDQEAGALRAALRARVEDDDVSVLEALYTPPAGAQDELVEAWRGDAAGYIRALVRAVYPADSAAAPTRTAVRLHAQGAAWRVVPALATEDVAEAACWALFFPLLLLTRGRAKTARAAWAVLADARAEAFVGKLAVLKPAVAAWRAEGAADGEKEDAAGMARVNAAVANGIAGRLPPLLSCTRCTLLTIARRRCCHLCRRRTRRDLVTPIPRAEQHRRARARARRARTDRA
jgi:hypothetical protein